MKKLYCKNWALFTGPRSCLATAFASLESSLYVAMAEVDVGVGVESVGENKRIALLV